MRIKSRTVHLVVIPLCYPPRPRDPRRQKVYQESVIAISKYVTEELSKLPGRCLPILRMDLSDQFGMRSSIDLGGRPMVEADDNIGMAEVAMEHFASAEP